MKWIALNGLGLAALSLILTINWWATLNYIGLPALAWIAAALGLSCMVVGLYVALEAWLASRG